MSRHRIRVYSTPRKRPEMQLLAQVMLSVIRRLHARRIAEESRQRGKDSNRNNTTE